MKHVIRVLVPVVILLLASVALAGGGGGHGEHHGINWWSPDPEAPPLGWFLINFVMFFGGLILFARKPVKNMFLQRHLTIKQQIEDAKLAFDSATERYEGYQIKLANVDEEAAQFIARGREDGQSERERILEDGKKYSERVRTDSETIVAQEYEAARLRLRRETVDAVMRKAEFILREQLTDDDRKRLVEEAITSLETDATPSKPKRSSEPSRPRAGGAA